MGQIFLFWGERTSVGRGGGRGGGGEGERMGEGEGEGEGEEGEEGEGWGGNWISPLLQMGLLLMVFRKAVREENFPLLHAARLALFPLWLTEDHPKYRHGMAFFLRDYFTMPNEVRTHIEKVMVATSTGRVGSSQGLDFVGEELNKSILRGVTPNPNFSCWTDSVRLEKLVSNLRGTFESVTKLNPGFYYQSSSTDDYTSDFANWQASIRISNIFAFPQSFTGARLTSDPLRDAKQTSADFLGRYSKTSFPNHPKIPKHSYNEEKEKKKRKKKEKGKGADKEKEKEEEKKKEAEEKRKEEERKREEEKRKEEERKREEEKKEEEKRRDEERKREEIKKEEEKRKEKEEEKEKEEKRKEKKRKEKEKKEEKKKEEEEREEEEKKKRGRRRKKIQRGQPRKEEERKEEERKEEERTEEEGERRKRRTPSYLVDYETTNPKKLTKPK